MTLGCLNKKILKAHEIKDVPLLGHLYLMAGKFFVDKGDIDHGCFLLTAAYVFCLEAGLAEAEDARAILRNYGREE